MAGPATVFLSSVDLPQRHLAICVARRVALAMGRVGGWDFSDGIRLVRFAELTRSGHTATAVAGSADRFAGANAIRMTPMTTSTAEPPKKPVRSLACLGCKASADITTA
jgi:hypothetical protein